MNQQPKIVWPLDIQPSEAAHAATDVGAEDRDEHEGAGAIVWGIVSLLLVLLCAWLAATLAGAA